MPIEVFECNRADFRISLQQDHQVLGGKTASPNDKNVDPDVRPQPMSTPGAVFRFRGD